MEDTQSTPASSLVVVHMLVDPESWLKDDQASHNDVANDLVITVEFVYTVAKDNASCEADNEQDDAQNLQRGVHKADSLCPRQVERQGE